MRNENLRTLLIVFMFWTIVGTGLWFGLARTSAQKEKALEPVSERALTDDPETIYLNTSPIDVRSEAARTMRQEALDSGGRRLFLVKFAGAIQKEWFESLKTNGFEVVDYIPNYAYLVWGEAENLRRARGDNFIVWDGAYLPAHKIQPGVFAEDENGRTAKQAEKFTVQLYRTEENDTTLSALNNLKASDHFHRQDISHYINLTVALDEDGIRQMAERPDVISIHPFIEPEANDEKQGRIVSGFVSGGQPVAGDYLAYLANKGINQAQFDDSFVVNVVDSGIDNGTTAPNHFALHRLGDPTGQSRIAFHRTYGTAGPHNGQGCGGHGTINAHIVGGYVPSGGVFDAFPHSDGDGYRYGLGIAPFVRLGGSVVLDPTWTGPDLINMEAEAYRDQSRISSNSWGSNSRGAYGTDSQLYDFLVRDAQQEISTVPVEGNQEYTIIFAAGNQGAGSQTMGSPGTAKNVITVGASESVQTLGSPDRCNLGDDRSDNANDIATTSSRGPTTDGRRKPEIVAPGTRITGGLYQESLFSPVSGNGDAASCYNASTVCGGPDAGLYFPIGQQWYTTSSGTSLATPAVAGGAALVRQYYSGLGLPEPPSPAMIKAVLMNSASYLTGAFGSDNLWSNAQGMGLMNLDRAFNTLGGLAMIRDQRPTDTFTATGQYRSYGARVGSNAQPVRITIAWTDQPGSTTGNSFVNNLDLEVYANGVLYHGNVFAGPTSASGGTADTRNNAESVFFPAGAVPAGSIIQIFVRAKNIAGDGIPGNTEALDQDFALIGSNVTSFPWAFLENKDINIVSENASPANNLPDPGETMTVSFDLQNIGNAVSQSTTVTLLNTGGIMNPSAPLNYGTIGAGEMATRNFTFDIPSTYTCGVAITLTFQVQEGSRNFTVTKTYTNGTFQLNFEQNFDSVTVPAMPSGWTCVGSDCGTDTLDPSSAPNLVRFNRAPGPSEIMDMESPVINLNGISQLEFYRRMDNASDHDGMILEIKIGAGAYQDIVAAGGEFVAGGYNCTMKGNNPLFGKPGWCGITGQTIGTTVVTLPHAAANKEVRLRWRATFTILHVVGRNMYIDSIKINGKSCADPLGFILGQPPAAWYTGDGDILNHFQVNNAASTGTIAYALGKVGQAWNLTATGNSVSIPPSVVPSGAEPRTFEFWVYTRPTSWKTGILVNTLFENGTSAPRGAFNLYLNEFPNVQFSTHTEILTVNSGLAQSEGWWHAAAVYDGATTIRFYVNGIERGSRTLTAPLNTTLTPLKIGDAGIVSGEFNGLIDEFTIFDRALSPGEIAAIHAAGVNGKVKQNLTGSGVNSSVHVGEATAVFPTVGQNGITSSMTLDPSTLPALPEGFNHSGLAYDLQTRINFTGSVNLCFNLPAFNNGFQFQRFSVMRHTGGSWTQLPTTRDFTNRRICAPTPGFSIFAIASQLSPTAANVTVSGRVLTLNGTGLSNARVTITNAGGMDRTVLTNQLGYYSFTEVGVGETYVFQVNAKGHIFTPQLVNVMNEIELNFTGQ